ncbi:MAG: hypothetical protein WKF96_16005 [Solirubrobacteraceae bacterium]
MTVQAEGEVELIDTLEFGAVLIDAHGQQHPAVYEDVALGPRLLDVRLRAGQRRSGMIVFDVPEHCAPERIQIARDCGHGEFAEWAV